MKKIYRHQARNQIARPETIRSINRKIVTTILRDSAAVSRAEIARETTLTRSSVSSIVDSLLADGIVEEIGIGTSSGGRKPTLLRLKTGIPMAIGVDMKPRMTTIAVSDLAGTIIERDDFPTTPDMDGMTERIVSDVTKFSNKFGNGKLSIGVSIPGITDHGTGKVLYVPYFQWRDWQISEKLAAATGLEVTTENDANAAALAEIWFGNKKIREYKDIITVLVGEGIGTGIVFDGQIYRGKKGAAGEFGHMVVGTDAPVDCSCGGRTCWEALASEKATLARYHNERANIGANGHISSMPALLEKAKNGDVSAVKAIKDAGMYLGLGISNLIVGLSPQAVIISGSLVEAWELIQEDLLKIAGNTLRRDIVDTYLTTSTLGDSPTLTGALSLVLVKKFDSL
jgi:predicted NBD/HSP70 family sugar kinase